jgi:MFS family permease
MLAAFKNRDYVYLWSGQAISQLGDAFHLVALPWLVLAVTGDPLQLGLVMAAAAIPRALIMLFGGAIADRFSPRKIMLASDVLRFAITSALVFAIFGDSIELWMIYALAIAFGTVSGFFMPAAEATIPRVLPGEQLEGGNSLMMIAGQIAGFVGPALAGAIVALLSGASNASEAGMKGIGVAFAVDALSFLASAITLWLMSPIPGLGSDKHPLHDIAEGFRFVRGQTTIRILIIVIALANFLMIGPLMVGIPVLASERLPQGAAAFGFIVAGYAFGNLVGMIGAGTLPRASSKTLVAVACVMFPIFSLIFGSLGVVGSTWLATGLMVVAGLGNGYLAIVIISSMQRMTPTRMLGRVMSLLMLAMYGLMPISTAIAGAVLKVSTTALFVGAAVALLIPGIMIFANRNRIDFDAVAETDAGGSEGLAVGEAAAPDAAAAAEVAPA